MSGRGVSGARGAVLLGVGLWAASAGAAEPRGHTLYTGQVNLNAATREQLDALPGVGAQAAQRILDWRQKRTFQRVEELVRVKGFGKKRFLRLKPYLSLQGATTFEARRVPAEHADPHAPGR